MAYCNNNNSGGEEKSIISGGASDSPSLPPIAGRGKSDGDRLDTGYSVRNSRWFSVGKVFNIIWSEPLGDSIDDDGSNVSTVLFGEKIYSHVARFAVVQSSYGFSYASPIQTYNGRGTLKKLHPNEYAVAYMQGNEPALLSGESSLTKRPIEIIPSTDDIRSFSRASRIWFGKVQAISHNVRAKEIGNVRQEDQAWLVSYFRSEIAKDWGIPISKWTDVWGSENSVQADVSLQASTHQSLYSINVPISEETTGRLEEREGKSFRKDYDKTTGDVSLTSAKEERYGPGDISDPAPPKNLASVRGSRSHPHGSKAPRRDTIFSNGVEYTVLSEVVGELHPRFELINKPRAFFKKGRVFMVLWPELAGYPETERTCFWKIRRYVVIRPKPSHCICLPIRTYSGKATSQEGMQAQEHAAVIPIGGRIQLHPEEKPLKRSPIQLKLEDLHLAIDPMSRINFARTYTVEYHLKVRNVGRVISESIKLMEEYFAESLGLGNG